MEMYEPEKTETITWNDIWFTAVFKWKPYITKEGPNCHSFNFYLYDVSGFCDDGNGELVKPEWEIKDAVSSDQTTENLSEAEPLIEGYLKWDGCCEWRQLEQEHFCGWRNFVKMHEAIRRVYLWGNSKFGFDYLNELPIRSVNIS